MIDTLMQVAGLALLAAAVYGVATLAGCVTVKIQQQPPCMIESVYVSGPDMFVHCVEYGAVN